VNGASQFPPEDNVTTIAEAENMDVGSGEVHDQVLLKISEPHGRAWTRDAATMVVAV
jgi:hypothetical protein